MALVRSTVDSPPATPTARLSQSGPYQASNAGSGQKEPGGVFRNTLRGFPKMTGRSAKAEVPTCSGLAPRRRR